MTVLSLTTVPLDVSWELLPFASLNDATGFHLSEGRWSRDRRFTHDYINFMYTYQSASATYGNDRHFSEAIADAVSCSFPDHRS